MSNYPSEKNKNKFLISERSCNYILRPVQARIENYPYTYRIANMGQEISVTVDRAWTSQNHMALDIIGNELYKVGYKNLDKQRNTWKNAISTEILMKVDRLTKYGKRNELISDNLKPHIEKYKRYVKLDEIIQEWIDLDTNGNLEADKSNLLAKLFKEKDMLFSELRHVLSHLNSVKDLIFGEGINGIRIEFKLDLILDQHKQFFIKRRREYIKSLFKKTSEVKFTFEYPLRVPVIENIKRNDKTISKIKRVDLQNVQIENDNLFNVEIYDGSVRVIFNTFFGNLFIHNLLTLNTDWFEENYLKLNGFASALYRRFFVTRSGNKFEQIEIKELVDYFDLLKGSRYPGIIEKAFEDIKNAGLICDYKINANGGKFSKGVIEVVKSSK